MSDVNEPQGLQKLIAEEVLSVWGQCINDFVGTKEGSVFADGDLFARSAQIECVEVTQGLEDPEDAWSEACVAIENAAEDLASLAAAMRRAEPESIKQLKAALDAKKQIALGMLEAALPESTCVRSAQRKKSSGPAL